MLYRVPRNNGPRLRDSASWPPLAAGASSCNLGPILSRSSVVLQNCGRRKTCLVNIIALLYPLPHHLLYFGPCILMRREMLRPNNRHIPVRALIHCCREWRPSSSACVGVLYYLSSSPSPTRVSAPASRSWSAHSNLQIQATLPSVLS